MDYRTHTFSTWTSKDTGCNFLQAPEIFEQYSKVGKGFLVPATWRDSIYWLPNMAEPFAFWLDDYFAEYVDARSGLPYIFFFGNFFLCHHGIVFLHRDPIGICWTKWRWKTYNFSEDAIERIVPLKPWQLNMYGHSLYLLFIMFFSM